MMTAYAGLRSRWTRMAMLAIVVVATSGGLADTAQADTWDHEHDLACDARAGVRGTFIFDPGVCNSIPQERFAQDLAGYYLARGFDRNFLTWAPTHVISPGNALWAGCTSGPAHPFAFCPRATDSGPVIGNVLDNLITAREWNGAFIAVICGNNSIFTTPGPVPRITGTKYEDRNGNGQRDGGEPGLGGVRITLVREGVDMTSTTTSGDGGYEFRLDLNANTNLTPGTYSVREDVPAGFRQTAAPGAFGVGFAIGAPTFSGKDFGNQRMTNLGIDKQASKDVTIAGESLDWTLTVTNRGLFDTPDVVVDDDIPAAIADTSDIDPACALAGSHLHCALGTMAPGAVRVLRFRTRLRADLDRGSTVRNCATVGSSYPDSNPSDNSACDDTEVDTRADLVTTKTVSTRLANGGDALSYTLTVRNDGPSDARDVVLRDPVPVDVVVLSTTPSAPTCSVASRTVTCAFGTLRPGETRTVVISARAAGSPPPVPTPSHGDHLITVSKAESAIALNAGQARTVELSCNPGAIATDGSARVDSVDQGTGDLASVKLLEARAISRGTYRFGLRNEATGRAQLHLYVTCLSGTTTGGDGPAHPIVTGDPVTATSTLAAGRRTITLALPLDHVAIAPSFSVDGGVARLVASEPVAGGWELTFDVTTAAVVTAAITPLLARVGEVAGHSHALIFRHIEGSVSVPARGTVSTTLSCAQDAKGIVASFDGPIVGHEPQPKSRVFRFFNPTAQAVSARVDLECINDRTGPVIDPPGIVTNTARAESSTADPDASNDAASARFVVYRALGSVTP